MTTAWITRHESRWRIVLLLVAGLLLSLPLAGRYFTGEPLPIGAESSYHLRIASGLFDASRISAWPFWYDEQVTGGRTYVITPYHFLLAGVALLVGMNLASILVPLFLGLLSLYLFMAILKYLMHEFQKSPSENAQSVTLRFIISGLVAISPIYIFMFDTVNKESFLIFLNLLGIYLLLHAEQKQKDDDPPVRAKQMLVLLPFILIGMHDYLDIMISFLMLLVLTLLKKERLYLLLLILFSMVVTSSLLHLTLPPLLKEEPGVTGTQFYQQLIADLGAASGFGIFHFLLGIIGFGALWTKQLKHIFINLILLGFLLFVIVTQVKVNHYLLFVFSIFAGSMILKLSSMQWELQIVRQLTLLLIVCGLLFSTISYLNRFTTFEPSKEQVQSLLWLQKNSQEDAVVLSHPTKGFLIQYYADRTVLVDSYSYIYASNDKELSIKRFAKVNETFTSRNLKRTKELLDQEDVDYIWVDETMKTGLVWKGKEEGLLFLFRNNETFRKVYTSNDVDIWEVMRKNVTKDI
ncbi:hypothetical protein HYW21_03155 [Candidatus Woesearchaeota archaeon]|nr:hypothetical protein [Candidatus Woesearchaeota archaeon]